MAEEQWRAKYEKWIGHALPHTAIARRSDGMYADSEIERLWKAWCAGRRAQAEQDGCANCGKPSTEHWCHDPDLDQSQFVPAPPKKGK
jgi:hypothetical protein